MTPEDLRLLAARATIVEDSPEKLRSDVHARIGSMRRHRQFTAVAGAVIAVVVALTLGTAVDKLVETSPPPTMPPPTPTPTRTPEPDRTPPGRPLVYAEGHRVHVGAKTVRAREYVIDVDVVDGGAVFATETDHDKQISTAWFTDGAQVVRLGRTPGSAYSTGAGISGSSFGPLVAWQDLTPAGQELAIYDTDHRREVGRLGTGSALVTIIDDHVYWTPDTESSGVQCDDDATDARGCNRHRDLRRYDARTGTNETVRWASYVAERRSRTRLLASKDERSGEKAFFEHAHFTRDGDRLVGGAQGPGRGYTVRDAKTGRAIGLRLPRGYDADVNDFHLSQWLDDEHFTVVAGWYGHDELIDGDILVCRTTGGRCRVLLSSAGQKGPGGYDGRRVPGHY